jgi:PAS domain S-box-containing protein
MKEGICVRLNNDCGQQMTKAGPGEVSFGLLHLIICHALTRNMARFAVLEVFSWFFSRMSLAAGQNLTIDTSVEMNILINDFDWSATSLGSKKTWSPNLNFHVDFLLHSSFPMFLLWGEDQIFFCNDAFFPSLSPKDKSSFLGKQAKEVLADLWLKIEPLINLVLEGQLTGLYEDRLLPVHRNGQIEEAYWTFSFSPIKDNEGKVEGVSAIMYETTERVKEANKVETVQLERRRKKLQQIVDNSSDFMSMATLDGQMTYLNAAGRKLIGLDDDVDVTTLRTKDFYSEEALKTVKDIVIPELDANHKWNGVIYIKHFKTGEEIPCFANYIIITDTNTGDVISRAATLRDLRPQLAAQKDLEDSEKRFRNLVQEAPVATAIYFGREMRIQWANDAMIRLWGKDKSVIGKTIREALPELEGQPFHQQLDNVFTTGVMYQGTEDPGHLIVDGQLQTFYFNFSYKPLHDVDGNIYGILNMAIDVTESVRVKRQLEESEKNFRSLILQAPVGITLLKGDDHIVELANDEYLELVGREREGFIGKPIWELIPEAKAQGFDVILKNVKDTGEPFFGNEVPVKLLRNGNAETVYINFVYQPLFDEEHYAHSILVIAIDVTPQVEARKLVEVAEERARLAIESGRLGTYEVNVKTKEVHASPFFNEIFDTEISGTQNDYVSRLQPDDVEQRIKAHEEALLTGKLEYESRVLKKDGSQIWIHAFGHYYFDEEGKPEKLIGIVRDITREKESEKELEKRVKERTEELEKLNEELQQFLYVSSHDLKEPLRKIHTFTDRIIEALPKSETKLLGFGEKIMASSARMTTLINDLLHYSTLSNTNVTFEHVDLNAVIKNIWEDMEIIVHEKKASIHLSNLPIINGIPFQINQLFYNLLNNALKFSKADISPDITIRCSVLEEHERLHFASLKQKSYYKIEVEDNGIGFEPGYAEKIFVVFQRLHMRHEYSGNGIGLSICKKIVQNHKGLIYAKATPGAGSTFTIILPQ